MRPSKADAEKAIKTILEYIGENPNREGLKDTPRRVVESYDELFCGYEQDPFHVLNTRFFDTSNFQDIVLLKNIRFTSICEHHMLPITGSVDVAYMPSSYVVGISKIARVVDIYARRLQIQEKMTADIAEAIDKNIKPQGVAVRVLGVHNCMTIRGVEKASSVMETAHYTGLFKELEYKTKFLQLIKS